jgi:hypothetical protein
MHEKIAMREERLFVLCAVVLTVLLVSVQSDSNTLALHTIPFVRSAPDNRVAGQSNHIGHKGEDVEALPLGTIVVVGSELSYSKPGSTQNYELTGICKTRQGYDRYRKLLYEKDVCWKCIWSAMGINMDSIDEEGSYVVNKEKGFVYDVRPGTHGRLTPVK